MGADIFTDSNGKSRTLKGVSILSGSARLAELAGLVGFDVVWVDMEHGSSDFNNAESICVSGQAAGIIPLIRTCDSQRTHILRSLEAGAKIVVVPMVNDAETVRKVVEYGKFPPLGNRGYNTRSRAVKYGIQGCSAFARANEETHLFVQVETMEAVRNLDEICAVQGISGIFIGPGDLSANLGITGEFHNRQLIEVVVSCIQRSRKAGKHAGILVGTGEMLREAIKADADIIICGGDIADLSAVWNNLLEKVAKL